MKNLTMKNLTMTSRTIANGRMTSWGAGS